MTTGVASQPRAFWGAYAASKAGMEALVGVYADEVENTKVRATLVNPGPMRTKMRAVAFPGEDPDTLTPPEAIGPLVVDLAQSGKTPPDRVNFRDWAGLA